MSDEVTLYFQTPEREKPLVPRQIGEVVNDLSHYIYGLQDTGVVKNAGVEYFSKAFPLNKEAVTKDFLESGYEPKDETLLTRMTFTDPEKVEPIKKGLKARFELDVMDF
ncbi:hypothetical protein ACFLZB_02295 [Nanoarchaeota archaeon]